ncbi:activating signal cointegrator 1 [Condylostylus longicornis]|uniref:activating signal cointegrator 1 n=1 Tax=Condylostylus longicornis TaxID=2530218 RepID=UPI00244E1E11|nr:activating signal cointegrator 1 [Condylostylus longicornis]
MEDWLKTRLSKCLNFEIPEDMIRYILSLKTTDEVDEYFETLLNYDVEDHKIFLNDFKQRKFTNKTKNPKSNFNKSVSKTSNKDDKKSDFQKDNIALSKKKTKYTNLYNQDGQVTTTLIPGRHHCDCQASKHKLINNCGRCGRIVCFQEGSGPCLFCGNLVCSEEELKLIKTSSKKGDNLKKSLIEQNRPKGWEEALAQRNRLLEYDRTSEKRTTVIDDESDYFKTNSVWLSESEKKKLARLEEEMRAKKHASRLSKKITIDFAGREIIEEPTITTEYEDEVLKQIAKSCGNDPYSNVSNKKYKNEDMSHDVHPFLNAPLPIYVPTNNSKSLEKDTERTYGFDGVYNRVQDKELLEIQDMRNCLSMHQPWASLLVMGIKKHEGRPWYTSHRGRLWIASTAKQVDIEEVKRMEHFYRVIYNDDNIIFPTQYPSGVLLGCVSVQDCLPQEEYRKSYPDGESDSPYVFICTNPQELPIKFPIKGQHKIYKLDQNIHTAAVKSLQRLAKLKCDNEI